MSPHGLFALSRHGTYHAIRSQSNRRAAGARATCGSWAAHVPSGLDKLPLTRSRKVEQMYSLSSFTIDGDTVTVTLTIPATNFDAAALQRLVDLLSPAEVNSVALASTRGRSKS